MRLINVGSGRSCRPVLSLSGPGGELSGPVKSGRAEPVHDLVLPAPLHLAPVARPGLTGRADREPALPELPKPDRKPWQSIPVRGQNLTGPEPGSRLDQPALSSHSTNLSKRF